ncbi:MAG: type II toxin-antitoxin system RelE/ParE family toxin [Methylococcaceae bacterium]
MPQIIYSEQANSDIVRFVEFMQEIEPSLKQRVISTIFDGIEILQKFPRIAKPSEDEKYKHMRELFIAFGGTGYVVLYEYHEENNIVLINSIRHTREAGYKVE